MAGVYSMAQNTPIEVHLHTRGEICVGQKVVLTCPDTILDKDVLTYEWVLLKGADSVIIGNTRSIEVSPTVSSTYHLNIQYLDAAYNLITKGDFEGIVDGCDGTGRVDPLPFTTDYTRAKGCYSKALVDEGLVKIGENPSIYHYKFFNIRDHSTGTGNMMLVNGNWKSNSKVWQQKISNIKPGVQYAFSAWGITVSDGAKPTFQFSISQNSDKDYNIVGGLYKTYSPGYKKWTLMFELWTPPTDWGEDAYITLIDQQTARGGNDFAVDDISFAPVKQASGEMVLNVIPYFLMETLPDKTLCEGERLIVRPVVNGDVKSFSWRKEGEMTEICQTLELDLDHVSPDQAGTYICTAQGMNCGDAEGRFVLTVKAKLNTLPPLKNQMVCKGSAVDFTVDTDRTDLFYEWTMPAKARNWTGQNTGQYKKRMVEGRDVGIYSVKIQDGCQEKILQASLDTFPDVRITDVSKGLEFCPNSEIRLIGKTDKPAFAETYWSRTYPIDPSATIWMGDTLIVQPQDIGDVTGKYVYHVQNKNCPQIEKAEVNIWLADTLQNLEIKGGGEYCVGEAVMLSSIVKGGGTNLLYEWKGPDGNILSTASTLLIQSLKQENEGIYTLTVADACGITLVRTLTIKVRDEFGTPVISGDLNVCLEGDAFLEVTGGSAGLKYEWTMPDGKKVASSSITILRILPQHVGEYVCRLTSVCGRIMELKTHVSLYPEITVTEPSAPFVKCVGDRVEFTVSVGANEEYMWMKDGVQVGKANASYVIESIRMEDVGTYQCVVSSPCAVKTLDYVLKVNEITRIEGKSDDLYVTSGTRIPPLFVKAVGSNLNYTWQKTGTGNIGLNINTLALDVVTEENAGEYKCFVRGDCGTATATIHLYVGDYNELEEDREVNWCIGSSYSYTATARPNGCTETASLVYSWVGPDGNEVSKTKALVINDVTVADAGVYTCTISGTCGTMTLRLTAKTLEIPVLTLVTDQDTTCEGERVKMSASVNDIGGHTFEWRHDGNILGTTINEHLLQQVAIADAGLYTCKVSAYCGEASDEVRLTVRKGLRILHKTDDLYLCKGVPTALEVKATGDSVTYAWAGPASGEWLGIHDAIYSNAAISHAAAGQYRCVVNSSCGTDTLYTTIDLEKDLELVSRTSNTAACIGDALTLYARVNLDKVNILWTLPDGTTRNETELPLNSITTAHRGRYLFHIQSPMGCSELKDSIGIGVYDLPGELMVNQDTSVCEGTTVPLEASMAGVDVVYHWMGPNAFESNLAKIEIPNLTSAKSGVYEVRAIDICKHERITKVNVSLREDFKDVVISRDTTVCPGSDIDLAVTGGRPDMVYTWLLNDVVVGDAALLPLSNVQEADTGKYICRMSSVCGMEERSVNLSLLKPLELMADGPLEQSVCVDETVVFGVLATGESITYEWTKEGNYVGTTDAKLILPDVTLSESGIYWCKVASTCGVENLTFELNVKPSTAIIGHSPDRYVSMGDSVLLFAFANGVNNRYEWSLEGNIVGQDSILNIPNVGYDIREYSYRVRVIGECGVDSTDIMIRVGEYIEIPFVGNSADTICEGSNYTYVAGLIPYGCFGGEPVVHTWTKEQPDGTVIEIKRDSSALFKIENAQRVDTGSYTCVITYRGCPIDGLDPSKLRDTTFNLKLDMIGIPVIAGITPKDTSIVEGFDHRIKVVASGEAITYTWEKDGLPLSDKLQAQLEFIPAHLDDAGMYKVIVENSCSKMSALSRLRVYEKTVIISPFEQGLEVCKYSDTTLEVEAVGSNLIYRWFMNDKLLAASSRSEYTIQNVVKNGDYRCVVSGKGGDDTCWFHVKVLDLPEINITGKESICQSPEVYQQEYIGVTSQVGLDWNWSCIGGTIISSEKMQKAEVNWNGEGEGKITVTATSPATGCMNKADKSIRYLSLPEIRLDLPSMVGYCIDSMVLNRVWPSGGYFISETDTITSVKFYEKRKDYEVTYYYSDPITKCISEATHSIGVDIEPAIRLAERNDTTGVCRNLDLVVASVTPGRVTWSGTGLNLDTTDKMKAVFMPVVEDVENVYYEAKVTDSYGCQALDYERILVVYPPVVKAMKDTVVGNCDDEKSIDLNLSAEYISSYFDHINWFPAGKLEEQADYSAQVLELDNGKNPFIAEVVDVFGCQGKDTVLVTLKSGPDIVDRELCLGDTLYVDNSEYVDFRWSDGYEHERRNIYLLGTDTLWVTDEFGCQGKAIYTVRPLPTLTLVDTFLLRGQYLKLPLELNPLYAPYDIMWQDGSGVETYVVENEGEYWVKVMDNMGCTAIDTAQITFIEGIYAPNAFLPESQGENARFYLKEVNFVDNFEMYIYNRWGELIFKTREIGFKGGWDGTFKGKKCGVGTYVWVAFNNGKRLGRGTVTLIK